jgi:hypothetical protein
MIDEPYDPRDRRINARTQIVAWLLCAFLIGSIAASGTLSGDAEARHQLAVTADAVQICG